MRALFLLLGLAACKGADCGSGEPAQNGCEPEVISWSAPTGRVTARRAGHPGAQRVVFVHGTPGDWSAWSRYLKNGGPHGPLELVAYDRPGFGESEPQRAVPSLALQVAALEPLLDGMRPILVGHSLGGPVALRAAADYPDRVGGVLVLAGEADPELEKLRWYNYAGAVASPLLSREMKNSNAELFPHRAELQELAGLLERVRCPVIVVHGTEDELVPYANATYIEARLTSVESFELVTLAGASHFFIWKQPEVVWDAIGKLLGAIETSTSLAETAPG